MTNRREFSTFLGGPESERHFSLSTKASLLRRSRQTRKIIYRKGFRRPSGAPMEIGTDPSGLFDPETCSNNLTEPIDRRCTKPKISD
jgi:hypothetical protein